MSPAILDHLKVIRLPIRLVDSRYLVASLTGSLDTEKILRGGNHQRRTERPHFQQIRMIKAGGDAVIKVLFGVLGTDGLEQARVTGDIGFGGGGVYPFVHRG